MGHRLPTRPPFCHSERRPRVLRGPAISREACPEPVEGESGVGRAPVSSQLQVRPAKGYLASFVQTTLAWSLSVSRTRSTLASSSGVTHDNASLTRSGSHRGVALS